MPLNNACQNTSSLLFQLQDELEGTQWLVLPHAHAASCWEPRFRTLSQSLASPASEQEHKAGRSACEIGRWGHLGMRAP